MSKLEQSFDKLFENLEVNETDFFELYNIFSFKLAKHFNSKNDFVSKEYQKKIYGAMASKIKDNLNSNSSNVTYLKGLLPLLENLKNLCNVDALKGNFHAVHHSLIERIQYNNDFSMDSIPLMYVGEIDFVKICLNELVEHNIVENVDNVFRLTSFGDLFKFSNVFYEKDDFGKEIVLKFKDFGYDEDHNYVKKPMHMLIRFKFNKIYTGYFFQFNLYNMVTSTNISSNDEVLDRCETFIESMNRHIANHCLHNKEYKETYFIDSDEYDDEENFTLKKEYSLENYILPIIKEHLNK